MAVGKIFRISGPVVIAEGIDSRMYDLALVGKEKLLGEVIQINGNRATIQVYEDTTGLTPGEPVENTGQPLSILLGPGMLSQIYDGIQRPLPVLASMMGDFIKRGANVSGLDLKKKWDFIAIAKKGDIVSGGDVLGTVQETQNLVHKILVPPNFFGKLTELNSGKFSVEEKIGSIDNKIDLKLSHKWPVRKPRPFSDKLKPEVPLITGQRILDGLFTIAKGGTGAIPGPFGSGKTVTQQQLAKWSDAQIVVYIGCGERGNEMTEVLTEFPELMDVKTGRPLMERTVLIANTSNMPVAAREASVYTGMTIAEYFRDQGYDVSLMADSTSRWAEAMREIGGRLEEMPGEEGYPAYLARRLAEFYERAGRVRCLGSDERYGSVTVIGAVSPPGGDISEPVSQNTLRVTKVFLALDASLAYKRHFPAINWLKSYTLYFEGLEDWYNENISSDFVKMSKSAMILLQKEAELQEVVQLVGPDALPEKEQAVLTITKILREDYLQQNAYSDLDARCEFKKQYLMLKTIMKFGERTNSALDMGVQLKRIQDLKIKASIGRMKEIPDLKEFDKLHREMDLEFDSLLKR